MKTPIREQLKNLASSWINPTYADQFEDNPYAVIQDLIVRAFTTQVPEGPETALLREAWKRLGKSALTGYYDPTLGIAEAINLRNT